jgi:hypothetical protein
MSRKSDIISLNKTWTLTPEAHSGQLERKTVREERSSEKSECVSSSPKSFSKQTSPSNNKNGSSTNSPNSSNSEYAHIVGEMNNFLDKMRIWSTFRHYPSLLDETFNDIEFK